MNMQSRVYGPGRGRAGDGDVCDAGRDGRMRRRVLPRRDRLEPRDGEVRLVINNPLVVHHPRKYPTCSQGAQKSVTPVDDDTDDDDDHDDYDEAQNAVTKDDDDTLDGEAPRSRLLLAIHDMKDAAGARTSCPRMPGSVPASGR